MTTPAGAGSGEALPPAARLAAPAGCVDVLFLGARGSGQQASAEGGYGREIGSVFNRVAAGLLDDQLSFKTVPVRFAAVDAVKTLKPSASEIAGWASPDRVTVARATEHYKRTKFDAFADSIDGGVQVLRAILARERKACPDERFLVAGYSQGAMVVHRTLQQFDKEKRADVLSRVLGVGLVADGDRVGPTPLNLGSAGRGGRGIASKLNPMAHDVPASVRGRTVNLCDEGDLVCDFSLDAAINFSHASSVHTSYPTDMLQQVGDRLVGWAAKAFPVPPPPRDSTVQQFDYSGQVMGRRVWPARDGWWLTAMEVTPHSLWRYGWISPKGAAGPSWDAPYPPMSVIAGPRGNMYVAGVDGADHGAVHVVRVGPDGPETEAVFDASEGASGFQSLTLGQDGRLYWWGVISDGSWLNQLDARTLQVLHRRELRQSSLLYMTGLSDRLMITYSGGGMQPVPYAGFNTAAEETPVPSTYYPTQLPQRGYFQQQMAPDGGVADMTTDSPACDGVSISYRDPHGHGWVRTLTELGMDTAWPCSTADIDARPGGGAVVTLSSDGDISQVWVNPDGTLARTVVIDTHGLDPRTVVDPDGVAFTADTHRYPCPPPYAESEPCSNVRLTGIDSNGATTTVGILSGDVQVTVGQFQQFGEPVLTSGAGQVLIITNESDMRGTGRTSFSTIPAATSVSPRESFVPW